MRGITERVFQIARSNGLEAQMLQDKEIKDFIDFNHQMFDGPQPSKLSNANSNRSPKELQDQIRDNALKENQGSPFVDPK